MLTDSTSSSLPPSMHHSIDADSLFGTNTKLSYETPFQVQDYHVTFFWKSLGDLSVFRDMEKAPGPVSDPMEVCDGCELEKNASTKTHCLTGKGSNNGTQRSGTVAEFVNPMDISLDLSWFSSGILPALSTSQEKDFAVLSHLYDGEMYGGGGSSKTSGSIDGESSAWSDSTSPTPTEDDHEGDFDCRSSTSRS